MNGALAHVAMSVSTEWMSKTVTTDPPRLTPHDEWRLVVRLQGAAAFRLAALVCSPERTSWGLKPGHGTIESEEAVHFFPHSWSTSNAVQVNFGWRRLAVVDHDLKSDPRPHVTVVAPEAASTGEVIRVCEVPRHGITVAALALSVQDTENRRLERWRVRPALADVLPEGLDALASGHQSGIVDGSRAHRWPLDASDAP
jgi:hypothetical protein